MLKRADSLNGLVRGLIVFVSKEQADIRERAMVVGVCAVCIPSTDFVGLWDVISGWTRRGRSGEGKLMLVRFMFFQI